MTPHFPIYLDYGATTPCDPRVVDAMIPWLRERGVEATNLNGERRAEEISVAQYCALAGQLRSINSIL